MSKYDEQEFLVPARDAKGHYETRQVNLQPQLDNQIGLVVASDKFPYRTWSDLVRHAIVRHLRWLGNQESFTSVMGEAMAMNELARQQEMHAEWQTTIERMAATIDARIADGDVDMAMDFYHKVIAHVDNMPDDNWRKKYRRALVDRYGEIPEEITGTSTEESLEPITPELVSGPPQLTEGERRNGYANATDADTGDNDDDSPFG